MVKGVLYDFQTCSLCKKFFFYYYLFFFLLSSKSVLFCMLTSTNGKASSHSNPGSVKSNLEGGSPTLLFVGIFFLFFFLFCLKAKIKAILPFEQEIPNTWLTSQRVHHIIKVSGVLKHF